MRRHSTALLLFILVLFPLSNPLLAKEYSTRELFQQYKHAIVQIRITNILSGEKSSIGSGFYVSNKGHVLTNFHVIASLIHKPDDYTVEIIHQDARTEKAELLNIDVLNDLAILKSKRRLKNYISLSAEPMQKGSHVASMGNPHDLGLTVVGGLYNGILKDSLHERIHFTGSINPGMSGGPALNSQGRVIGINVATSGNAISFLVPAHYAISLLNKTTENAAAEDFYQVIGQQLLKSQADTYKALLATTFKVDTLGDYKVPGKLFQFLKCWGDSDKDEDGYYEIVSKICSSNDDIYLDSNYSTGAIYYRHKLISSSKLNSIRFAKLYENVFKNTPSAGGVEKYLGNYNCQTSFVEINGITMKTGLCFRPHKKIDGLYDMVMKAATLESKTSGLQTSLLLTGISYKNAIRLTEKYLQAISWAK